MRLFDAYRPTVRNPTELISRHLTPQIVGRGFEVGAMRGGHAAAPEPTRVLRDGRLIVVDPRRSGSAEGESGAERADGRRPVRAGESSRPAEAGGRVLTPAQAAAAAEGLDLSLFEKIFLAHFEGGIPVASEGLAKGEFRFLPKTEKGWAEFFQRFAAFTLLKTAKASDVQALVVRGLIRPDGTLTKEAKALLAQSKLVLVSDVHFANGKTDKFARLPVPLVAGDALLQAMSKLDPGVPVTPEMFSELLKALGGPEFSYLSLSHKIVNPDMAKADPSAATQAYQSPEKMKEAAMREGVRDVTQGIALSAKTEKLVAERLDIDLKSRSEIGLDRRAGESGVVASQMASVFGKKKKRSSLWGGAADEGQDASVFAPWYQHFLRPKKLKGKPRWWVPFTYVLAASAAALAAYYAFRFWL